MQVKYLGLLVLHAISRVIFVVHRHLLEARFKNAGCHIEGANCENRLVSSVVNSIEAIVCCAVVSKELSMLELDLEVGRGIEIRGVYEIKASGR